MRRSLTTSILITVIVIMALTLTAYADANFGLGVSKTTTTPQSQIGTTMDLERQALMGLWASTMGTMPVGYSSSNLRLSVSANMVNYKHIDEVRFVAINRFGKACTYKATLKNIRNMTYTAVIDMGALTPGTYSLMWEVKSGDKVKTLDLLLFEINTRGSRSTAVSNQMLVQSAPCNEGGMSDQQAFAYLRGFAPGWATPDPGYLASQQMLDQMTSQPAQSTPQPVVQQPQYVQPSESEVERPREKVYVLKGCYHLILSGLDNQTININLDGTACIGSEIIFRRNGYEAARAKIVDIQAGKVFAEVESIGSNGIKSGDSIKIEDEGVR